MTRAFCILWLLLALSASSWAQTCTVDKTLDFPNLKICGKLQDDFCVHHSETTQRLTTLEQQTNEPFEICGGGPDTLCNRVTDLENQNAAPRTLCGFSTEQEFCNAFAMAQNDQQTPPVINAAEILCLASPIGEVKFLRLGSTCPCGFEDVTTDYEHRFVSIGGMDDLIGTTGVPLGTTGVPLGSRTTTVETTVTGLTTIGKNVQAVISGTMQFVNKDSPLTGEGEINTADVAPSLALMICERKGQCECDV